MKRRGADFSDMSGKAGPAVIYSVCKKYNFSICSRESAGMGAFNCLVTSLLVLALAHAELLAHKLFILDDCLLNNAAGLELRAGRPYAISP